MNEVAVRPEYELPTKFEDVASFAIITQEKLKSVRAEISAIQRLGLAQEVLKQKVREAQDLAGVKTRAEMKLGELTAAMPKAKGVRRDLTSPSRAEKSNTKAESLASVNISTQKASQYELMAANPDIVEQAIAEARENEDIVSRSSVLKKIKEKNRKAERQAAITEQLSQPKTSSHIDIFTTDRFYASSKTYSVCGHKKDDLRLSDRIYHCEYCGAVIDRDKNASMNLYHYGKSIITH